MKTQVRLQLIALYGKVGPGLNHRLKGPIGTVVLFKMSDRIKIGDAYDSAITAIGNYGRGNHEMIVKVPILFSEKRP